MPWPIDLRLKVYRSEDLEQELEFKDLTNKEDIDFTGFRFYCPLKESLDYSSTIGELIVDESRKSNGILILSIASTSLSEIVSDKIYGTLYRINESNNKKEVYCTLEIVVEDGA